LSVADQAAIAAANATQNTAVATWWLVIATGVLVAVTLGAVIVGGLAARSATETYRLEAEPVLIVTSTVDKGEADLPRYVVAGNPALAQGLVLRPWVPSDGPTAQQGLVAPYGGTTLMPSVLLDVENVGRSPAVDVEIDIVASIRTSYKPGIEAVGFVADKDDVRDTLDWNRMGTQSGTGIVRLPAVGPQRRAQVRVENALGLQVKLDVGQNGRQLRWDTKARKVATIPVISPLGSIRVKSPTG
jgi:hypothetical protein